MSKPPTNILSSNILPILPYYSLYFMHSTAHLDVLRIFMSSNIVSSPEKQIFNLKFIKIVG